MSLIRTSVYKPITMLMVVATLAVFGVYTFRLTGINLMPEVDLPYITVQVIYPGAGPREIESSVVEKLEDGLSLVDGVDEILAYSNEGFCFVVLKFKMGVDINVAATDVKDKIESLRRELPADIEDPVVSKFDFADQPILSLALLGPSSANELRNLADNLLKDELARIPGVATVDITGGLEREIAVDLRKAEMKSRGISLEQIVSVLRGANLNFPLGELEGNRKTTSIRLNAEFTSLADIRELQIPTQFGIVRLGEIARVSDTFKKAEATARFNRKNAVGIDIKKRSDANMVAVADKILARVESLRKTLPENHQLYVARNNSLFIRNSVNDVYSNIIIGILLTGFVLFVFLRNARTTIIAAVTMPVSVISTFTLIYAFGFTLNFMTLMALGIAVGLLVTNSIVVLENIMKYLARGTDPKTAAELGTSEIATAVLASTLTNVAVFVPIAFMQSMVGQMFKEFGLTMTFATFVSLLISFTLTPLMAAYMLKPATPDSIKQSKRNAFTIFRDGYLRLLEHSLSRKGLILFMVGLLATMILTGGLVGRLGGEFIPKADEGAFDVQFELPAGSNLETTDKVGKEVERILSAIPEVATLYTTVGGASGDIFSMGSGNSGSVVVQLVPKNQRQRTPDDIVAELRPILQNIPDATVRLKATNSAGGNPNTPDIEIQLLGTQMDGLLSADSLLQSILESNPQVVDIKSSWKSGKPELVLRPLRNAIADFGLVPGQMASLIRGYVHGIDASVLRQDGEETDIRLRLDERHRATMSDILALPVSTQRGFVPLSSLTEITREEGPSTLARKDKVRLITVSANLLPGITMGEVQTQIQKTIDEKGLPAGVQVHFGGDAEMMAETVADFIVAMIMAILLTYILLTAILESFSQPLIIMATIPLGAIGVVWALFFTGEAISLISLMAMVMLIGIVVNNAILLLDEANRLNKEGVPRKEAIMKAAKHKLEAILMTNIATIFSMLPLAMGIGEGAEMRQPMAVSSIGGLLVSTIFTMFLIPVLYYAPTALWGKMQKRIKSIA